MMVIESKGAHAEFHVDKFCQEMIPLLLLLQVRVKNWVCALILLKTWHYISRLLTYLLKIHAFCQF